MSRSFAAFCLIAALWLTPSAHPVAPAMAASIVAVVNGEAITSYDLEQRQALMRLTGERGNVQQKALDELIDERLQLKAAQAAGITASEADIDRALGDIAKRVKLSPSQLGQALGQQGVAIKTLRNRLAAQIAFARLVRARFQAEAQVSEQDLVAALLADEDRERVAEAALYDLEQITIALPDDPSDSRLAEARSHAKTLQSRFTSCSEGIEMAKGTKNVVVQPFGRRMDIELTNDAREVLQDVPVGRLSDPISTSRGLVMFAVCDKEMVQSTNAAMKALEPELTDERGDAFMKQYLRQLRRDAVIEKR